MKLAGFEGTLSKSCWSNYQVGSSRYSRGVFVLLPNAKDCASTSLYITNDTSRAEQPHPTPTQVVELEAFTKIRNINLPL